MVVVVVVGVVYNIYFVPTRTIIWNLYGMETKPIPIDEPFWFWPMSKPPNKNVDPNSVTIGGVGVEQ